MSRRLQLPPPLQPVAAHLIVRAAASRVPLRRRAPELVTSPPGSPAHAQSPPSRLPPRRPAPALIPGRVAAIAPGRPAPVGTPRRGNFLLLYTSGRGAAFRRGQGVVNAPRSAPLHGRPPPRTRLQTAAPLPYPLLRSHRAPDPPHSGLTLSGANPGGAA